ncbi:farnesol dehydrogenase-like isoform X1 [Diorhabda sublineata]|uniref:farnesol dehydrogenase-like isoform X1 n=1 Tax=Diorhabda sublineata TaxID=1163346 RepID=UPI0024E0CE8F|nr:farnesol dehydrogenase-like isoform X1 [Diorhabda sublineata]
MLKWKEQVAFVTGVNSGIGEAIAEKLVEKGLKVVGFATRSERLIALAQKLSTSQQGKFYPIAGDITNEDHIIHAFQWTQDNIGPVSVLINNTPTSVLYYDDIDALKEILNETVLGICIVSREAIKHMKENNIDGYIINVGGLSRNETYFDSPCNNSLNPLTETLRLQLAADESEIRITSLSYGCSESDFCNNNGPLDKLKYNNGLDERISVVKPSDIAEVIIFVLSTPKRVNISKLTIQPV